MIRRHSWLTGAIVLGIATGAAGQAPPRSGLASVPGAPAGVTAFVNVAIVPMDTERVLTGHTVLVEGGRITAMGPVGEIPVPAKATRIDGQGKYLMPGLVDMHAHFTYLGNGKPSATRKRSLEEKLFATLAEGVTTVRNLDHDALRFRPGEVLALRARAAAGEIWSPRIYTSGEWGPLQYLNAAFQDSIGVPLRLDSIEAYLRAYKAAGYDFVKLRETVVEIFDSVLIAARRVGIPVVGHRAGSLEHAVAQGLRSIEHISQNIDKTTDMPGMAAAIKQAGLWGCICPPALAMGMRIGNPQFVQALRDAGVGLLAGTDGAIGGPISYVLDVLVQQGLTPYEALAMSTTNPARYIATELKGPVDVGTVAVGKRADLILLNGNPLEDVLNTKDPAGVMIGGRWLDRDELNERLAAFESTP